MEGKVVVAICAPVITKTSETKTSFELDVEPVLILNAISSN
jgi:hypothetical protein